MEFGSIIEGDCLEELGFRSQYPREGGIGLSCCSMPNLGSASQACHPIDESEDAFKLVASRHRVTFPMTELSPVLGA